MKTTVSQTKESQHAVVQRVHHDAYTGGTATFTDNRPATVTQRQQQVAMKGNAFRQANRTGLPDRLKAGIESLSGYNMDDVKVHYNAAQPAQLQAHAFARGSDIYIAPGQEKYLPHEAWHVVQQKQGSVKPTLQFKGAATINDDAGLEKEADVMGARALAYNGVGERKQPPRFNKSEGRVIQRRKKKSEGAKVGLEIETTLPVRRSMPKEGGTDTDPKEEAMPIMEKYRSIQKVLSIIRNKDVFNTSRHKETAINELQKLLDLIISKVTKDEKGLLLKNISGTTPEDKEQKLKEMFLGYMMSDAETPYDKLSVSCRILSRLPSASYRVAYQEDTHYGDGWKATGETIGRLEDGLEKGQLLAESGVEIVTDPVASTGEAQQVMKNIFDWLDSVVDAAINKGSYEEKGFVYEIPNTMRTEIVPGGKLLGNIQVNLGASLSDVQDVFDTNKDDIDKNETAYIEFFNSAVHEIGSNTFWNEVKKRFYSEGETSGNAGKKQVLGSGKNKKQKNKKQKSRNKATPFEIEGKDELFLQNIMFQYLYLALAYYNPMQYASTSKNQFPILIKTPLSTQVRLSEWENKDTKWNLGGNNNDTVKGFRKRFGEAIKVAWDENDVIQTFIKNRKTNMGHVLRKVPIDTIIMLINSDDGETNFFKERDIKPLNNPKELQIGEEKYAGVFELRYLQNKSCPQDRWLPVWEAYLTSEEPAKNKPKDAEKQQEETPTLQEANTIRELDPYIKELLG